MFSIFSFEKYLTNANLTREKVCNKNNALFSSLQENFDLISFGYL